MLTVELIDARLLRLPQPEIVGVTVPEELPELDLEDLNDAELAALAVLLRVDRGETDTRADAVDDVVGTTATTAASRGPVRGESSKVVVCLIGTEAANSGALYRPSLSAISPPAAKNKLNIKILDSLNLAIVATRLNVSPKRARNIVS